MIFLWCMGLAFGEELLLRVAINDTEFQTLREPSLQVNGVKVPLLDDGSISGDVAADHIFVTTTFVRGAEDISLGLVNKGRALGSLNISIPNTDTYTVQLKTTASGFVEDSNAPTMPWEGGGLLSLGAEALTGVSSSGDGTVRLRVLLNDQSLKGLRSPTVRLRQSEKRFVDDGTDPSDTALDNIWLGWIDVPRQERVRLLLADDSLGMGFVDVSLPATPAATVVLYRLPSGLSRFPTQLRAVDKTLLQATAVVGVAPRGGDGTPLVELQMKVDMRGVGEIENPRIVYTDQTIILSDDDQFGGQREDGIYHTQFNVTQSNVAEIAIWNGEEELGKATVFLPEAGRAELKVQINNGLHLWTDRRVSDLPLVAFSTAYADTRPLTKKDTEQNIDVFINGPHDFKELRLSSENQVLGVYPITQEYPLALRAPIHNKIQLAFLSNGIEKEVWWVIPEQGEKSFVSFQYDNQVLSLQEDVIIGEQRYAQRSPLIAQGTSKSDETFAGKTLLQIRIEDPLQELQTVQINDTWGLEKASNNGFEGSQVFPHAPFVVLSIKSQGRVLSTVVIFLPESTHVALNLVNTRVGIQVNETSSVGAEEPLIFEAVKEGKEGLSDKITVLLLVDDRVLGRLTSPNIRLAEEGRDTIALKDNGEEADTKASDQVYSASFVVGRAEYLQVAIEDRGKPFGEMTAFLPSSSEAKIRLRTVNSKNGVKLLTEAQALKEVDSPDLGSSAEEVSVSEKKLVHILWVMVILFSLFFAYIRAVVYRTWKEEIRPLLERLEKMLTEKNQ